MKLARRWVSFVVVGLVAAGAGFATRAVLAEEAAGPAPEKPIDGHALVKALSGAWTTAAKSALGDMKGSVTYSLACGNTVLLSTYKTKTADLAMDGLGVLKISADGKTATQWWFDSLMEGTLMMTGPVTNDGFTLEGSNKMGSSKVTLSKKGDGFEFKMWADGQEFMTETYTKAK